MSSEISNMQTARLCIEVPAWVDELAADAASGLIDDHARMAFTVRLSRENVARGGGPFGATVFAGEHLLAAGVNLVLSSGFSIAHAEVVALMRSQLSSSPNSDTGPSQLSLYASTEPCCQCFGALIWSGVSRLVCGATSSDAEAIGFDEGPKPESWATVLERRGIAVTEQLLRADAVDVLQAYRSGGGTIYGMARR